MKQTLLAAAAAFALSTSLLAAQTTTPSAPAATEAPMPKTPAEFAMMAASSNMLEIETSRLALQQGKSEEVKAFAQHMIDDHTKAAEEMMPAAQKDGVAATPAAMAARHQAMMTELTGAGAENFDAAYVTLQIAAHEEAVALFESYSDKPGALGEFAKKTLPTLQEHLQEVQKLKM